MNALSLRGWLAHENASLWAATSRDLGLQDKARSVATGFQPSSDDLFRRVHFRRLHVRHPLPERYGDTAGPDLLHKPLRYRSD